MSESARSQQQLFLLDLCRRLPDLGREQLLQMAVESCYFDYFEAAAQLAGLEEQGLVQSRLDSKVQNALGQNFPLYFLSPEGHQVLHTLSAKMPSGMRAYLDELSGEVAKALERHVGFRLQDDASCIVEISQYEKKKLIYELKLRVPNENMARTVCRYLESHPDLPYTAFFEKILRPAVAATEDSKATD